MVTTVWIALGACAGPAASPASGVDTGSPPSLAEAAAPDVFVPAAPDMAADASVPAAPDMAADVGVPSPTDASDAQADAPTLVCPTFAAGVVVGTIGVTALAETSGLVESRRSKGVLWLHDDAGAAARLFAVGRDGVLVGTFDLVGARAEDWEDIAIGPGPTAGVPYLYVGDIGDNDEKRASVQIYRVAEPAIGSTPASQPVALDGVDRITLVYPDGAHNAETLLVDPLTADVFIVTKSTKGDSRVFRAPAPLAAGAAVTMKDTGVALRFGVPPLGGDERATAGDISVRGDKIVVRTRSSAFLWRRSEGQTVTQAMTGVPCPVPLRTEPQGEAFGFAADDSGYYTTSEGKGEPIYWFAAEPHD